MRHIFLACAIVAAAIHVGSAQQMQGTGTGRKGKVEFSCVQRSLLFGPDNQELHLECAALLDQGRAGLAVYDWQPDLSEETRIRSTTLLVAAANGSIGTGEERVIVKATFTRDELPVPTCQSKRRITLTFNKTVPVNIEQKLGKVSDEDQGPEQEEEKRWIKSWDEFNPNEDAPEVKYDEEGYEVEEDDEEGEGRELYRKKGKHGYKKGHDYGEDKDEGYEGDKDDSYEGTKHKRKHGKNHKGKDEYKSKDKYEYKEKEKEDYDSYAKTERKESANKAEGGVAVAGTDALYKAPEQASSEFDEWQDDEADEVELAAWEKDSKECPHKIPKGASPSPPSHHHRRHHHYDSSSYEDSGKYGSSDDDDDDESYGSYAKASGKEGGVSVSAIPAQNRKTATPGGLNVVVKCKSAPAQEPSNGQCFVVLRLIVRFTEGFRGIDTVGLLEAASNRLVNNNDYICRAQTFIDVLNTLRTRQVTGGSDVVNPLVCFPPGAAGGAGRRLAQADTAGAETAGVGVAQAEPAQSGSPTIPAGAVWNDVAIARAIRLLRYNAAIHGCLPGQTTPDGTARNWADVASWGGPAGDARNQACLSCFKDGVNYGAGLGGPPVGWETPDWSIFRPASFRDAAIVLTDTAIIPGTPSIIVIFRPTITTIQKAQWISNVGFCLFGSVLPTARIDPDNEEAGGVCVGWKTPIDVLNLGSQAAGGTQNGPATGLMQEVKNRLRALRNADGTSSTRIFVTAHSRGGAFAATFAAMLLSEQQAGRLENYVSPLGIRSQVSLYTFGAPAVGNRAFASYLERRMFERFRVINRFDPIVAGPTQIVGYYHWRPSVWYRQADGTTAAPEQYCLLSTNQQIAASQLTGCFTSCRNGLLCSNAEAVPTAGAIAGTPVPASTACQTILDSTESISLDAIGRVRQAVAGRIKDHATYMGVSMANEDSDNARLNSCRLDVSAFSEGCIDCIAKGRANIQGCGNVDQFQNVVA